jgi:hypothetical protein
MITKRVLRYFCDFCRRGSLRKSTTEKHERGCTANPNRICGLCEYAIPTLKQKPIADLIACLSWDKDNYGMADLRNLCEGCPGCILAAIRQSGMMKDARDEGEYIDFKFDLGII